MALKCNVKWPPIKDLWSWLLAAWVGNWVPRQKAQAETDPGGTEGAESANVGFKTFLEHHPYSKSCCAGGGGSCCAWRQAPAHGTGSLRVQLRLENPVFRETKSCICGWQWLTDCSCPADCWTRQGLRSLDTHRKKGLPHDSWTQQELWPEAPSLLQQHNLADPWRDAVLQTWQVLLFGASLLCGGSCEVITAIFNGANTRASPSSGIPIFKIRKTMKVKWHLSPLKTEKVFVSLPASSKCQLKSCLHAR